MSGLFADLDWRGQVHQMTDDSLEDKLDGESMTAYIGFDPTADSLQAGNLVQLVNLARLQRAGHQVIVLAGGATGMIGDPGGRSSERNLLDVEKLRANVEAIEPQLRQFFDFEGPRRARLVNNLDWTQPVSVIDFLRDVGKHFTVNQLVARDSVRNRMEGEHGISFTEFSYGLLQAFDFWHLFETYDCTLQLGGSDQWANIVGGVDLIRRREGAQAFGLCTPLVTKADGTKFGKSVGGAVWLDPKKTSPYAFYQFFVRVEDTKVIDYLKAYTFLPHERIEELAQSNADQPGLREAHRALAEELTRMVHGAVELQRAQAATAALFSEDIAGLDEDLLQQVFIDAPSVSFDRSALGAIEVVDVLVQTGLSPSKSAARTAIDQGGVSINNRRQDDSKTVVRTSDLLHDRYILVRRGKKAFALAQFGDNA